MPHTHLLLRLLVLIAFGTACGSSETPTEEEEVVVEPTAAGEPETEERSAETAPSANTSGAQAPDPAEMAEGMAQFRAALDAAANAEGDSPCEKSYNGILAMIAAMPETSPEESGAPTPEVFIEGCSQLPEAAQTCLNPGYGAQHPECRATLASPEVQAFAQAVGGDAPPAGARPGAPPSGLPQASPGATPCERAYNGMQAMFDSMPDTRGAQMPEQARFMAACAELPEETAQCADPGYGAGHPECMEWLGTPEAMAFRTALQPTN